MWKPRKVTLPLGYAYIVENDKGVTLRRNGILYATAYHAEAQEVANKLNKENVK